MSKELIEKAKEKFGIIMDEQLKRVEVMKMNIDAVDYSSLNPIIIGICWGDGIGEVISKHAEKVISYMLKKDVEKGKIKFKNIEGLTIENRVKHMKAIP
ncbi:MAG: isocitrate/isopropylmalate dehydrogenase family protein, partial [Candidatus Omnitrophica bacterium]|nr:isocitrate/isopropylmalate dehydrogenase family protein [Candidatus Omnitrophota bacterium]